MTATAAPPLFVAGRTFVGPAFDYLLIGGGLSLVVSLGAKLAGVPAIAPGYQLYAFIVFNYAHFAASTVRLYTLPGAVKRWPFVTVGSPLVAVAIATAVLFWLRPLLDWLLVVSYTWSAFHYAAQAYGISIMYAMRSGCALEGRDKHLLRAAGLFPFVADVVRKDGSIATLFPSVAASVALPGAVATWVQTGLVAASFVAPAALFFVLRAKRGRTLPAIVLLLLYANAAWWTLFRDGMFWVTVFHSVQYIAVVVLFHQKDAESAPGPKHGRAYHAITFYAVCVALGYALFELTPQGYDALGAAIGVGFGGTWKVVAHVVNIHHFFVDGYIWKFRRDPRLASVVEATAPATA